MTELVKVEKKQPYRKYTQEQVIEALEQSKGLIAPYTPLSSVAKPGLYAFTSNAWPKTVATSRRQRYPALVVSPSASSLFTMNSGYPPRWWTDLLGGGGGSLKSRGVGGGGEAT